MKKFYIVLLLPICLMLSVVLVGCNSGNKLMQYLSEYRSDIFMATEGKHSIFASFYEREVPYKADGHVGKKEKTLEVAFATEDNTKRYFVAFNYNGKQQQNLLYYDSLQMVHTCYFSLAEPKDASLQFLIYEGQPNGTPLVTLQAKSVRNNNLLPLEKVLAAVEKNEKTLLDSLTQGKQFLGEIYVRLLVEENYCYFYVGIIDRAGKTTALLVDGELGEILAKRES